MYHCYMLTRSPKDRTETIPSSCTRVGRGGGESKTQKLSQQKYEIETGSTCIMYNVSYCSFFVTCTWVSGLFGPYRPFAVAIKTFLLLLTSDRAVVTFFLDFSPSQLIFSRGHNADIVPCGKKGDGKEENMKESNRINIYVNVSDIQRESGKAESVCWR